MAPEIRREWIDGPFHRKQSDNAWTTLIVTNFIKLVSKSFVQTKEKLKGVLRDHLDTLSPAGNE